VPRDPCGLYSRIDVLYRIIVHPHIWTFGGFWIIRTASSVVPPPFWFTCNFYCSDFDSMFSSTKDFFRYIKFSQIWLFIEHTS
jgi:hypothetical protein